MILLDKKIKEKIESIAIHYSEPKQIAKSIEEFAELQQVLAKYLANGGTYDNYRENLTGKLADVIIMLNQIIFLECVDEKDIESCIDYKLNRQLERIANEQY